MEARFTGHASSRILDRLSLTRKEIKTLLDADLCILIGRESSTNRVHKLFFSMPDSSCFVAVQDDQNGEVVTILPFDYHGKWEISLESLEQAQALVEKAFRVAPVQPSEEDKPGSLIFMAYIERLDGKSRRAITLGRRKIIYCGGSIEAAANDKNLYLIFMGQLRKKMRGNECLIEIRVKKRSSDAGVTMRVEE